MHMHNKFKEVRTDTMDLKFRSRKHQSAVGFFIQYTIRKQRRRVKQALKNFNEIERISVPWVY